jgi:hypothetical protein
VFALRLVILFFFLIPFYSSAQTVCSLESRQRLDEMIAKLSNMDLAGKSGNELAVEIGQWFLQTPYVEKTLELPGKEELVVNLTGVDCTTFLETVVTLSRIALKKEFTFEAFEKELEQIRYREGQNKGYSSRLHYFSDWIYQNQQHHILRDITKEIGGSVYVNNPSFMSENPQFYAQLSESENLRQIKITESEIKTRSYYYLPKEEISRLEKNIQAGDIIAITTSMSNLDIVHVGFAVIKNGRIHLLHASSKNMKVEISALPLSDYLKATKSQSGIMVGRLTGE